MRLTLADVYQALLTPSFYEGEGRGGVTFTGISTDTRTIKPGDLFVALASPNMDGHQFVAQALAAGATGQVVSQPIKAPDGVPVIHVLDTQVAYGQIACFWRDQFDIPVIGVTGSVGKTTTKEMLAAALSPLGPVLKTEASQNNETGVPKALLQLNKTHKAAVVEMGMRGPGQIAYLCGIARPTIGVITLIGENHIELLGSRDAIADAKGELLEALPADGLAVLNADDPFLPRLRAKTTARVLTYGLGEAADYRAARIERSDVGWRFQVQGTPVEIASPSRHDIGNALAAVAVAGVLGLSRADAAQALRAYAPPPMRMQVVETPEGITVLNDAYNAAPVSVKSALQTLSSHEKAKKIAFLGDMKELGEIGPDAHRALGKTINDLGGLDAVYAVGELAAQIPGATQYFTDSAQAAQFARETLALSPGDVILVKGSRAMAMERVVEALMERRPEVGMHGV